MLIANDLSYTYPGGTRLDFPDLTCGGGETRLLLGPSGSGKTTLLQLLAGLRTPATGSVTIDGTRLDELSGRALDRFRGANIGLVFQTPHFVRSVSVLHNLRLAQQLSGEGVDDKRIIDTLERLDVAEKRNSLPSRLSVGQQQRVAIARAVLNEPKIILADEPTSALDDRNAERVLSLLTDNAARVGAGLLIITHDNRLTSVVPNQTTL